MALSAVYAGGAPIDGSPAPNGTPGPLPPIAVPTLPPGLGRPAAGRAGHDPARHDAAAGNDAATGAQADPVHAADRPDRSGTDDEAGHPGTDDDAGHPGTDDGAGNDDTASSERQPQPVAVADLHAGSERQPEPVAGLVRYEHAERDRLGRRHADVVGERGPGSRPAPPPPTPPAPRRRPRPPPSRPAPADRPDRATGRGIAPGHPRDASCALRPVPAGQGLGTGGGDPVAVQPSRPLTAARRGQRVVRRAGAPRGPRRWCACGGRSRPFVPAIQISVRPVPSTTSAQGPAASPPPAFSQAPQTPFTARRVCIPWVPVRRAEIHVDHPGGRRRDGHVGRGGPADQGERRGPHPVGHRLDVDLPAAADDGHHQPARAGGGHRRAGRVEHATQAVPAGEGSGRGPARVLQPRVGAPGHDVPAAVREHRRRAAGW